MIKLSHFKLIAFLLSATLSFTFFVSFGSVNAQDAGEAEGFEGDQAPAQSVAPGPATCVQGYRQFLSSVIGYEGFGEYWKDIFSRSSNPCFYGDIRSLEERLRHSRAVIRSAFLRCDLDNMDNLTNGYHQLEAELYFLRHAVIKDGDGIFVMGRLGSDAERRELQKELKKFFVIDRGLISDEQLTRYIGIFEAKYTGRVDDYNACRSELYGDIEEKLKKFWEQIKSLGGEMSEAFATQPERQEASSPRPVQGSGSVLDDVLGRVYGIVDAVEIEPETEISDLSERINPFDNLPTFTDVRMTLDRAQERVATSRSRAQLLKKYELIYGVVGDDEVKKILEIQNRLIKILQDSSPLMERADRCLRTVEKRECSDND